MKRSEIVLDRDGKKVVILSEVIFNNKQNINWSKVEKVDIKKEASNPLKTNKKSNGTKPLLFD